MRDFKLTLHNSLFTFLNKELTLTEHIDAKWMPVDLIATLDWVEADIEVVDKMVFEGDINNELRVNE